MDITRRRNLTAAIPSSLLRNSNRFEDLGTFDEEECRFFLREIGDRIVPSYPFFVGIEEVYSLILEKYGYAGLPDATSVLQDLLESDDTANGLGDDGDVWRSWRHNWKRRNDDLMNVFIPKIGSFILQPPTLPHIRKIKAANFIREGEEKAAQEQAAEVATASGPSSVNDVLSQGRDQPYPPPVDDSNLDNNPEEEQETLYLLPATTYAPPNRLTGSESHGPFSTALSEYSQANLARASSTRENTTNHGTQRPDDEEVTFAMLDPSRDVWFTATGALRPSRALPRSTTAPALRGGHDETTTPQQVHTVYSPINDEDYVPSSSPTFVQAESSVGNSPATTRHNFVRSDSPYPQVDNTPRRLFSRQGTGQYMYLAPDIDAAPSPIVAPGPRQDLGKENKYDPAHQDNSVWKFRKISDSLKSFSRRVSSGENAAEKRRIRAKNRQARVLDDMILMPKVRNRLSSPPTGAAVYEAMGGGGEKRKSIVRRSLTPVWQKFFRSESGGTVAPLEAAPASNLRVPGLLDGA